MGSPQHQYKPDAEHDHDHHNIKRLYSIRIDVNGKPQGTYQDICATTAQGIMSMIHGIRMDNHVHTAAGRVVSIFHSGFN